MVKYLLISFRLYIQYWYWINIHPDLRQECADLRIASTPSLLILHRGRVDMIISTEFGSSRVPISAALISCISHCFPNLSFNFRKDSWSFSMLMSLDCFDFPLRICSVTCHAPAQSSRMIHRVVSIGAIETSLWARYPDEWRLYPISFQNFTDQNRRFIKNKKSIHRIIWILFELQLLFEITWQFS